MRVGEERNTIKVRHVKFDDQNAGLETMQYDVNAQQQYLVPIQKREVFFTVKKKKPNLSIKRTLFSLVLY